jgi:peroxiredoxin Q/BCP
MIYFACSQPTEKSTEEEMMKLSKGDTAPDFALPDQNGNQVSLNDFKGKKVILYFYPKANTSG